MCEGFGLRDAGRVEGMRVGFTRKRERFEIDVANCTEAALEQVAMQARAVRCCKAGWDKQRCRRLRRKERRAMTTHGARRELNAKLSEFERSLTKEHLQQASNTMSSDVNTSADGEHDDRLAQQIQA